MEQCLKVNLNPDYILCQMVSQRCILLAPQNTVTGGGAQAKWKGNETKGDGV